MELLVILLMALIVVGPSLALAIYYETKYELHGKAYMIFLGVLTIVWMLVTFASAKPKRGRRSNV